MSNSYTTTDNIANACCSMRENVPGYTLQQAENFQALLPTLYTKCQTLIAFLGIYCNNMNHDASLWYSWGCSVLVPGTSVELTLFGFPLPFGSESRWTQTGRLTGARVGCLFCCCFGLPVRHTCEMCRPEHFRRHSAAAVSVCPSLQ